jgi:hypothetical protein
MYESPIDIQLINRGLVEKIAADRDDAIMAKISQQLDVRVDKYELERALAYDRGQYDKGFADGVNAGIQKTLSALTLCGPVFICNACKHVAKKGIEYPCIRCRYITQSDRSQYYWDPVEVEEPKEVKE